MSATTVSIPQQFSIGSPQQRNMQTAASFAAATRGRVASDSIKDVGHMQIVSNGEHPLHSLATVAAAAANVNGLTISSGSNTKNIVANVWIPPRLDQIEVGIEGSEHVTESHAILRTNASRQLRTQAPMAYRA